ncbi:MAG: RteC domain-containing protein [Chitinophagaceae bacterium]
MSLHWESLLDELLEELIRLRALSLPESDKAELCFRLAVQYWHRLKERFFLRVMNIDKEEIEFFKQIKPVFTAFIEYYLMINQSLLFMPEGSDEKLVYWTDEEKRYHRFNERNETFIAYYKSGLVDQDDRYFLQRNNQLDPSSQERIYEDEDCRSSHDHLVRGLLAGRMYGEYVQEKLNEL